MRPIASEDLISPCDGKVMHSGPVDVHSGLVEQVKGDKCFFLTVGWKIFNRIKILGFLKKEVGKEDEYRCHFLRLLLYFKILGEV